jgi:hypothetical protein
MLIDLVLRDMLFINYTVPPERLRPLVPKELELETVTAGSHTVAFVSVVSFKNVDIRSPVLPVPGLSFEQINYRTYVNTGEGPAVYFFEMKVDSRMVAGASAIINLPVSYEGIEIVTTPAYAEPGAIDQEATDPGRRIARYEVRSSGPQGLTADVTIGGREPIVGPEDEATTVEFITQRPVGYVSAAAGGILKIVVEHERLDALTARPESVRAPMFESLGVLNMDESRRPHSALYVRDAVFHTNPPAPWLPDA